MNDTSSQNMSKRPETTSQQGVLYVPSIVVAVSLILFLGVSFYRYHKRNIKRRRHFQEYAKKNLSTKRKRIRGYIAPYRPTIINGNMYLNRPSSSNPIVNAIPLATLSKPFDIPDSSFNENIYLNKPQTPQSYFDVRHPVSFGSRLNYDAPVSDGASPPGQKLEIPLSFLCKDCKHNVHTDETQASGIHRRQSYQGEDNPAFYPGTDFRQNHPLDSVDNITEVQVDEFEDSHQRPNRKKHRQKSAKRTQRHNAIHSRTFPNAKLKIGVLNLEKQ